MIDFKFFLIYLNSDVKGRAYPQSENKRAPKNHRRIKKYIQKSLKKTQVR